jgi:hypothetical protein
LGGLAIPLNTVSKKETRNNSLGRTVILKILELGVSSVKYRFLTESAIG